MTRRCPARLTALGACLALLSAAPPARAAPRDGGQVNVYARVDGAVAAAAAYLQSRIGADGRCADEYPADNPRHGGKTALCALALLEAGAKPNAPAVRRALRWLARTKLEGVSAVAARACAYAAAGEDEYMAPLQSDVYWLILAANADGGYTYASCRQKPSATYDNANAHLAALGVAAGAARGVKIPREYWQRLERYWRAQQQLDGGWGYRVPPGALQTREYGSMTAAGLGAMYLCFEQLYRDEFARPGRAAPYKPIADALRWMNRHFAATANPRKGVEWYHYWLFAVQRVGAASGFRYLGGRDWFAEALPYVIATQQKDGRWGYGDGVVPTAFCLMFLAGGRHGVLVNKLQYAGKWNARPRDVANLVRWIGNRFEARYNWQIVTLDGDPADWLDAPILYLSGAGPAEFAPDEVDKLRNFVYKGGLILSEAAGNNGDFTLDMEKLYRRMFPRYRLSRLPADHPVYTVQHRLTAEAGLSAVSNGIRLLAVHAPRELSLALQLNDPSARPMPFELLANLYLFATARGEVRPRGERTWPKAEAFTPAATFGLARLKYVGNYDPEPLAFERLATLMGKRHRLHLAVSEPMAIADLDAGLWPVASLLGTDALTLTGAEKAAIQRYVAAGGTLIVEAAGASKEFAASVRKEIFPLVGGGRDRPVATTVLCAGPEKIAKVRYRPAYEAVLGDARHEPQIRGLLEGERFAVLFSEQDLTAGVVGYPRYKLDGYSLRTAEALMINMICYGAQTPAPATQEAQDGP